jgi:hypothetical protein
VIKRGQLFALQHLDQLTSQLAAGAGDQDAQLSRGWR